MLGSQQGPALTSLLDPKCIRLQLELELGPWQRTVTFKNAK